MKTSFDENILTSLKKRLKKLLPSNDGRTKIQALDFIVALVFCYLGDSKHHSLEAIRRFAIGQLEVSISKSAFWERFLTTDILA